MKVSADGDLQHINVLVSGNSGTGKTSFASTADQSLYLAFERQASVVVRQRQAATGKGSCVGILHPEGADDIRAVITAFHGARSKPFQVIDRGTGRTMFESDVWPRTLVIDSVTDAVRVMQEEIDGRVPVRRGKHGFEVRDQPRWGEYKRECGRMFRAVRDVPAHVIWLAILSEGVAELEDGTRTAYAGPALLAKTHGSELLQTTNIAGISRRRVVAPEEKGAPAKIRYAIQLVGDDHLPLKEFRPLGDWETPDFGAWCQKLGVDNG